MKTVILAGGRGTRLSEYTNLIPKPMVEIGGYPILWHIMKIYSTYGINEFIIALGYKGEVIKDYFLNYQYRSSDITVNLEDGIVEVSNIQSPNWIIHLVDTGRETQTGGRLRRLADLLDDTFMMTYGDGVANINISELMEFHKNHGKEATLTAVTPPARYGDIEVDPETFLITKFREKVSSGLVNGGFYVLNPSVLDHIDGDNIQFEKYPLEFLSEINQLMAYQHKGFWQCMDTVRDVEYLERLWQTEAPWKVWEE